MRKIISIIIILIGAVVLLVSVLNLFYIVKDEIFKYQELQSFKNEGGAEITLQLNMNDIPVDQRAQAFKDSQEIIFKRIRLFGFYPFIKSTTNYKIVVQLAHVGNIDALSMLIGRAAQLSFWEENPHEASPSSVPKGITDIFQYPHKTNLNGTDLNTASITHSSDGKPQVQLTFKSAGAKKFTDITKRNVGKIVAIVLDNEVIETPRVSEPIYGGNAVITGAFTTEQAKTVQIQLNAGAFPAPITVVDKHYLKHGNYN